MSARRSTISRYDSRSVDVKNAYVVLCRILGEFPVKDNGYAADKCYDLLSGYKGGIKQLIESKHPILLESSLHALFTSFSFQEAVQTGVGAFSGTTIKHLLSAAFDYYHSRP